MSEVLIEVETAKRGMDEIRAALDAIFEREFPGDGVLRRTWDGDVLRLAGHGANGTVVFRDGRLVGEAVLKPPASLLRPVIERKMTEALREAAGAGKTEPESTGPEGPDAATAGCDVD